MNNENYNDRLKYLSNKVDQLLDNKPISLIPTFVTKNSPRTLKNRPIWSHLLQKAKYREQNIYASGHTAEDVASRML